MKWNLSIQFAPQRVDREAGIIHGCAVASIGEARGHNLWLDKKTLAQLKAAGDYYKNGVKVKVDHGSGVMATIGHLKGFRIEGDVLRGDLHVLKTAGERDKLFEMAEKIPDTFGLSVSFSGEDETVKDDAGAVKKFARCDDKAFYSIDLVTEAAANPQGLFSAKDTPEFVTAAQGILNNLHLLNLSLISARINHMCVSMKNTHKLGGPGSGNFGHTGRPGEVGGSGEGDGGGPELTRNDEKYNTGASKARDGNYKIGDKVLTPSGHDAIVVGFDKDGSFAMVREPGLGGTTGYHSYHNSDLMTDAEIKEHDNAGVKRERQKSADFDPVKEYGPQRQIYNGYAIERTGGSFVKDDPATGESHTHKQGEPIWHVGTADGMHSSDMFFDSPEQAKAYLDKGKFTDHDKGHLMPTRTSVPKTH
jgi:hypothetical protein